MPRVLGSADYIFQRISSGKPNNLSLDGEKKDEARRWYRDAAKQVTQVNATRFVNGSDNDRYLNYLSKNNIGQMFIFWYDAKLKKQLPYWDRLPLIFPIELYSDGFLGINLHYLPLSYRARLMDALYNTMTGKNERQRLLISYGILKSAAKYRYFKPCVKKYLSDHVNSKFMKIEPNEWDMALFLPLERFQKARKERVFSESLAQIKRTGTS